MKFIVTYRERRGGSDPAAARRAARLPDEPALPPGLAVLEFVSRIGSGGGYAIVETGDPRDLQQLATLFSACDCTIEPVVDVVLDRGRRGGGGSGSAVPSSRRLPDSFSAEPHEGAFSDDDVYDTED